MAERGCNRFRDAGGEALNHALLADLLVHGCDEGGFNTYLPPIRTMAVDRRLVAQAQERNRDIP